MNPDLLNAEIGVAAHSHVSARQLAKRLRELLPGRLAQIEARYRRQRLKPGKAQRFALCDGQYLEYIDEVARINGLAVDARLEWEAKALRRSCEISMRSYPC